MEIIVALIGGGATIAAAVVSWILTRKSEQGKREELQRNHQIASKALINAQKHKYGFMAKGLRVKVQLLDLEPNCVITRDWIQLSVSPQTSIAAIPGFFNISPGEFTTEPRLISKNDFPKALALRTVQIGPGRCDYAVDIAGMLTPNDKPLDCSIQISHRGGHLMTREEVEQAYPSGTFRNEYHRCFVEIPLDELEMEIEFPEGYGAECFPGVFVGRSETMDDSELHRIKECFQRTGRGAMIRVDGPLLGYSYAIYWISPTKATVAAMKSKEAANAETSR